MSLNISLLACQANCEAVDMDYDNPTIYFILYSAECLKNNSDRML